MNLETLDDHAYVPASLAAAEPAWVTHLLAKLQNVDTNVNALRLEVATFRSEVSTLHGEVNALRADVAKNTADLSTITENLPSNSNTANETSGVTLSNLAIEVARLRRQADEQPVLRANSCAPSKGTLYNPTIDRKSVV